MASSYLQVDRTAKSEIPNPKSEKQMYAETLDSKHSWGVSLYKQRKHADAEIIFRDTLQGREKILGAEHENTLASKHWLGISLDRQYKHEEAEVVLRDTVQGREKILGAEHTRTLDSKHWLGLSLYGQNKHAEAEAAFQDEARGCEKTLGAEHARTLDSKHWLGMSLDRQGKHAEAEAALRDAVQGCEKILGAEHENTLASKHWLGLSLNGQNKYAEAEAAFRDAAQGSERTLGANYKNTLDSNRWIAISLKRQGKHAEADGVLRDAVQGRDQKLGADDEDTLATKAFLKKVQEADPVASQSHSGYSAMQTPTGQLNGFFDQNRIHTPYTDSEIYDIQTLLKRMPGTWDRVPRLYIILRIIDQLDLLNQFVDLNFSDYSLPLTERMLPGCLRPGTGTEFLKTQDLVLTTSLDLEKGESGQHCRFSRRDPLPFELNGGLGSGGFGQVDKVTSRITYKEYALKRVRRDSIPVGRTEAIRQMVTEIETLKGLKHRHIVQFIGSYTDHQYIGFLMLPVAEQNLTAYLCGIHSPRWNELRTFVGCLARALEFLHNQNIRHKDIKPSNILVHGGSVLLTDFGLSLKFSDAGRSTTEGRIRGVSWPYCAPEVASWQPRNRASDIWSLGVVFLEMVAVLKGKKMEYVQDFLQEHGSMKKYVYLNPQGTASLIEELETKGDPDDNRITARVREMLQIEQKHRPKVGSLVDSILFSGEEGEGRRYCGICCVSRGESPSDTDDSDENIY